ncbi:MAG: hypothetical protein U0787_08980 [Polyangia bacterium]
MKARMQQSRSVRWFLACTVWLGLGLHGQPVRAADEYQQHLKRGQDLVRTEEYSAALSQFEAAYALRQAPTLLYQIARCHHRLGNTKEAKAFYKRYLSAGDNIDARREARTKSKTRCDSLAKPPNRGSQRAEAGSAGRIHQSKHVAAVGGEPPVL